jgi:hypothetical protein
VVSEENSSITLIREGRLVRNLDAAMLRDALHRLLLITPTEAEEVEAA